MKKYIQRVFKNIIKSAVQEALAHQDTYDQFPKYARKQAIRASYNELQPFLSSSLLFNDRQALWDYALNISNKDGLMLETGVFRGESINYFAKAYPGKTFHGFDSFIGLSENWTGLGAPKESAFDLKGNVPTVRENVTLVNGWVEDTFEEFLKEKNTKISFLHIDTDTYKPAKVVLTAAKQYMVNNTLILFDEFHSYPNYQNHELKAFREFQEASPDLQLSPLAIGPEQMLFSVGTNENF